MTKLSKNGLKRKKVKKNRKKTQIYYVVCLSSSISIAIQVLGRYMPCSLYLTISGQVIATSLSHSLPISCLTCHPCTVWPLRKSPFYSPNILTLAPSSAFFLVLLPGKQCFSMTQQLDLEGDQFKSSTVYKDKEWSLYIQKQPLVAS